MTKKSSITISTVAIFILQASPFSPECMDLIFIQDRWAYHFPSDNVNNVRPEALIKAFR